MVGELQEHRQEQLRSVAGALVRVDEPPGPCSRCQGAMRVRKTCEHGGITLEHGSFRARETVYECAAGCTKPAGTGRSHAVIQRQAQLAQLLLPRGAIGYDVMAFVGLQRFVHYRQRDEIRATLEAKYGITLSSGEVGEVGRRFLVYLEALHQTRAPALRKALEKDGGWPMHIDATGEDGRGTLFVVYAGWRHWALGSWKIPTECADAILPKMRTTAALFGSPCAIMRDLGKASIEASRDFVAGLKKPIPILGCHLHFLKDIGKDLLRPAHDDLRELFRRFRVLPRLRAQVRGLGRTLGAGIDKARLHVADWLAGQGGDGHFQMPEGHDGLAVVRAFGQWVLDYPDDGTDAGFPFDSPRLDLYRRCLCACRAVESLICKPSTDERVYRALEHLHRIVECVRSELPFQRPARILEARAHLFNQLRDALRLELKPPAAQPLQPRQQLTQLRDVKKSVAALRASLKKRRPMRGPAQDTRKAIDLILAHLKRHGPSLWGHVIALPPAAGGGIRVVERTNVILESFFHTIKHGERRRSGRKVLTQDLEHLPAAAILARNLAYPDYVAILCGGLEHLHHAFAELDAPDRTASLPVRLRRAASPRAATDADIVSSSLPGADKALVRTVDMQARMLSEARSRAPRHPVRERQARLVATAGNRCLPP